MKRFICILTLLLCNMYGWSASPSLVNAATAVPVVRPEPDLPSRLRIAQMKAFTTLTVKQYENLHGQKLNLLEKAVFKLSQKRMKSMLRHYDYGDVTVLQKISWLLSGLVFGPLAVLTAYIFMSEDERELIKWAWIGFAGWLVLLGVAILAFL